MNDLLFGLGLWAVVAWPLLLAIPALRARLPRPCHLALLPAALMVVLPGEATSTPAWFVFGSGLGLDASNRWLLAMAIAIWLMAASAGESFGRSGDSGAREALFLLSMAGHLGAVLAVDLVAFFVFSTLMGYAYYGLLVQSGRAQHRHAGHLYLIVLVLADLALFEALLLAAYASEVLVYASVRQVMAAADVLPLYLGMGLAGFALKAGLWPAHLWLTSNALVAPRGTALLLGGAPVAVALLGTLRWLPIGADTSAVLGTTFQVLGAAAVLYAVFRVVRRTSLSGLPAWALVAAVGLFFLTVGTGLTTPEHWRTAAQFGAPFIVVLGVAFAFATLVLARLQMRRAATGAAEDRPEAALPYSARWVDSTQRRLLDAMAAFGSLFKVPWPSGDRLLHHIRRWDSALDAAESQLRRWPLVITFLAFAAVLFAYLTSG